MAKAKSMNKKRFVRAALAVGGIGLVAALATAVALRRGQVVVTDPVRYSDLLREAGPQDEDDDVQIKVPATVQRAGEMVLERVTKERVEAMMREPAASVTGETVREEERDMPPPPTRRISPFPSTHRVHRGRVSAILPVPRSPNEALPRGYFYDPNGQIVRRRTGDIMKSIPTKPDVLDGQGVAETLTAAQKKLRATKASILNHGVHLIGQHIMPHLKKPRGQTPAAVCKNYKAQLKKLPAEAQQHALAIGHGILLGGGLGKRGKRAFSTAAKLAAVAGTLGALYLAKNHLKSGIQTAWNAVPEPTRVAAHRMAEDVYDKTSGAVSNLRHGVTKLVRPDGTLAEQVANRFSDDMQELSNAHREGRSMIRGVRRFFEDNM